MNVSFSTQDEVFREEVRRFFAEDYPKDLLQKSASGESLGKHDLQRAERALASKGRLTVNWPQAEGGPGWSAS